MRGLASMKLVDEVLAQRTIIAELEKKNEQLREENKKLRNTRAS